VNTSCQSKRAIADDFSGRGQIGQGTGRRVLHLAEVIRHAMEADA